MNSDNQTTLQHEPARREWFWAVWAVAAAFGCYFSMYGFRRPFTAASYSDAVFGGLGFKTVLVTSQVAGYMVSKFLGIKIVAEMPPRRRAVAILAQIIAAEAALVLFGLLPRPWNAACLFLNGLSLGMVFGMVLGFLEGRRTTEALVAGLCASFILADGVTKSVGAWLLAQGVSEDWMPAVAGLLFLVPLVLCVGMLTRVPAPSARDVEARAVRVVMTRDQRWSFVRRYAPGLVPVVLMYLAVTIVRSIRADFAPEIWRELGDPAPPGAFASAELWVALGVLALNGSAVLIADSRRAFFAALATCGVGFVLLGAALIAERSSLVSSYVFMVLMGLGLYVPYVAVHTTVFERLLAVTREHGNLGFLMYLADSIGYLGYAAVMVASNFGSTPTRTLDLLIGASWLTVAVAGLCLVQSAAYFAQLGARREVVATSEEPA